MMKRLRTSIAYLLLLLFVWQYASAFMDELFQNEGTQVQTSLFVDEFQEDDGVKDNTIGDIEFDDEQDDEEDLECFMASYEFRINQKVFSQPKNDRLKPNNYFQNPFSPPEMNS